MNGNSVDRRRALRMLAALAMSTLPVGRAFAATKAGADKDADPATPPPAGDGTAKDAPVAPDDKGAKGAGKTGVATLVVAVVGNDQPVAQAEVKVKFPPGVGNEVTLSTNAQGEAVFKSSATGTAKVRVIVAGWMSALQDVTLKEGSQRVTIKLTALPN